MAVRGGAAIRRRFRTIERNVRAAASQAMDDIAEDLLTRSIFLAKEDTGDLIQSAGVAQGNRRDSFSRSVFYDTPYALRQHEDPLLGNGPKTAAKPNSPLGDGAPGRKWLSRPFDKHSERYVREFGQKVEKALRLSVR